MAIDNQFRIDELISKGSRAIISKDSQTGNHTFTVGSKQIINDPYPHTKGDRDGEQIGTIEKPKYNEEELVKAVDTVVDELISAPKKEQPPVVPKPLYDDLRRLYDLRGVRINELEGQVRNLLSTISELEALIESLQIELDAAKLQQTVAENQSQQINEQYVALLQDFSTAIIKSTKEGIERVSLKAQTEGLIAQKESLREQLRALNVIVGQLQAQVEAEQQRQAASEALEGREGTQDQKQNSGWKLPQSELKNNVGGALVIKTKNDNKVEYIVGTAINFYNFNDSESQTFNISLDSEARKWLSAPTSITLPPRVDGVAGRGYVTLRWKEKTDDRTGKRDTKFQGNVIVSTSLGDTHTIPAIYDREADRADTWGTRGNVGTVIGSEKT